MFDTDGQNGYLPKAFAEVVRGNQAFEDRVDADQSLPVRGTSTEAIGQLTDQASESEVPRLSSVEADGHQSDL